MAMFTIRVELHDATWTDYNNLATQLGRQGITDIIQADNGNRYKLPPAEYNYVGNATLDQVYNAVNKVASTLGKRFAVLANEVTSRTWTGLSRV
ncbi:hypothetical protein [Pseudoduganella sp. R-34]|uniref:hypothetical protein n=1 Tax=Pseudoduganella sp. R-34 TaxID=3404062 RepID=UPI003CF8BDD9